MSSFVCSKKHYRKVRDLTYYLLKSNKYYLYNININEKDILDYVNKGIYDLIKLNIASYNLQYNENVNNDYNDIFDTAPIEKAYYNENTLTTDDLIGLYNAYACINYQIELSYDTSFIDSIKALISNIIIRKIEDSYECNHWEYED